MSGLENNVILSFRDDPTIKSAADSISLMMKRGTSFDEAYEKVAITKGLHDIDYGGLKSDIGRLLSERGKTKKFRDFKLDLTVSLNIDLKDLPDSMVENADNIDVKGYRSDLDPALYFIKRFLRHFDASYTDYSIKHLWESLKIPLKERLIRVVDFNKLFREVNDSFFNHSYNEELVGENGTKKETGILSIRDLDILFYGDHTFFPNILKVVIQSNYGNLYFLILALFDEELNTIRKKIQVELENKKRLNNNKY